MRYQDQMISHCQVHNLMLIYACRWLGDIYIGGNTREYRVAAYLSCKPCIIMNIHDFSLKKAPIFQRDKNIPFKKNLHPRYCLHSCCDSCRRLFLSCFLCVLHRSLDVVHYFCSQLYFQCTRHCDKKGRGPLLLCVVCTSPCSPPLHTLHSPVISAYLHSPCVGKEKKHHFSLKLPVWSSSLV